jgi:hypothetical protein
MVPDNLSTVHLGVSRFAAPDYEPLGAARRELDDARRARRQSFQLSVIPPERQWAYRL